MFARVTMFEIDTLRISVAAAVDLFKDVVMPELHKQAGYAGMQALCTPEGKGLLISLWQSEDAAKAGVESGYYDEQVQKFVMFTRHAPGREQYEVVLSDVS